MSCNEWKELTLEEIGDIVGGGTPSTKNENYYGDEISWITPKDLSGYTSKYISKGERSITKLGLEKSSAKLLPKGTVLFSSRAPIGYVAIAENELATNQGFKSIICNPKIANNQFIYYRMKLAKEELESIAGGSTFKEVSGKVMKEFRISLPPLEEQEKIANILSSLDDKIELNNEMNKTLEEMAQSIFKRWFVDFEFPSEDGKPYKSSGGEMVDSELGMIPKGWEVTELREIFVFKKGKKPKEILNIKEDEQYKKYLTIDVLNQKSKLYATVDKMIECSNDDILMVMDGASSGSIYTGMTGIVASTLAKLEVKNSILKPYIYQLLKYKEVDIKCHLTGSAIPHTDKAYIHSQKVVLPKNLEELKTMNKILKYIMDKIRINKVEVEKLKITRDTLLPKLMSGEIKIN